MWHDVYRCSASTTYIFEKPCMVSESNALDMCDNRLVIRYVYTDMEREEWVHGMKGDVPLAGLSVLTPHRVSVTCVRTYI